LGGETAYLLAMDGVLLHLLHRSSVGRCCLSLG
jgi:hypothetical protein